MTKDNQDPTKRQHKKLIVVAALIFVCATLGSAIPVVLLTRKKSSSPSASTTTNAADGSVPTLSPSIPGTNVSSSEATEITTTELPTDSPTEFPTTSPGPPTSSPTGFPTTSERTDNPTTSPTKYWVEPNPVPENPPKGYFNYDINDDRYGPNAWSRVDTRLHFTLKEFGPKGYGTWRNSLQVNPNQNRCNLSGKWQSPKDLVQHDGIIKEGDGNDGICDAHHEIRTSCGDYSIDSDKYKKAILPHKLTVIMNRRTCRNMERDACRQGHPPYADYPKYSPTGNGLSDLLNYDIKVPGEHTIAGEVFDAEIQMLHAHMDNEKLNSLGIPIRATSDGHNADFQEILNQFHLVHRENYQKCLGKRRRNLRQQEQDILNHYKELMKEGIRDGWYNEHTAKMMTDPDFVRELQTPIDQRFNPYSEELMPGMFFFRYLGSMTEPPCMFLEWWVMDKPMIISFDQLRQIKFLLFTHADESCQRTSVHNAEQSVARPVQPLGPPETSFIQHCQTGKFRSDLERFGTPGRRCQ